MVRLEFNLKVFIFDLLLNNMYCLKRCVVRVPNILKNSFFLKPKPLYWGVGWPSRSVEETLKINLSYNLQVYFYKLA